METKILIYVQSGSVQEVRASNPESVAVTVVDADSLMAGGQSRSEVEQGWKELCIGTEEIPFD